MNHFIVTRHVWHQGYLLSDILYWIQSLTLYINSFRVDPAMNSSNRSSAAFRKIFFFSLSLSLSPFFSFCFIFFLFTGWPNQWIYTELRLKTVSREGSAPWDFACSIPDISPGDERKRNRRRSSRPSSFFSHGTSSNRICLNSFHLCPCLFITFFFSFNLSLSLSLVRSHTLSLPLSLSLSLSLLSFIYFFLLF